MIFMMFPFALHLLWPVDFWN